MQSSSLLSNKVNKCTLYSWKNCNVNVKCYLVFDSCFFITVTDSGSIYWYQFYLQQMLLVNWFKIIWYLLLHPRKANERTHPISVTSKWKPQGKITALWFWIIWRTQKVLLILDMYHWTFISNSQSHSATVNCDFWIEKQLFYFSFNILYIHCIAHMRVLLTR